MENRQQILEKIEKLYAIAKGSSNSGKDSAEIANEGLVAMLMAKKLLAKYHIDESELQQQAEENNTVYIAPQYGVATIFNPYRRANARGLNKRRIWFEKLANVVAEGNYCKIGILPEQGAVEFYGFEMDREVAIFTFEKLAEIADILQKVEAKKAKSCAGMTIFRTNIKTPEWVGDDIFSENFHQGFREEIRKLFADEGGNLKSSEGVQEYWEKHCRYSQKPENIWGNSQYEADEIEINDYYISIGKKLGEEAIKRLNLSSNPQDIQAMVKTNIVKKQEKEVKRRLELQAAVKTKMAAIEAKVGIDYSLQQEVIIAVDDSGSMDNSRHDSEPNFKSKIQQAKEGALEFAKSMNKKGYKVGLVTFGSPNDIFIAPKAEINGEFTTAIEKLSGYGGTPMHEAIKTANEYFKTTKARRTLMIVTDGFPNSKDAAETQAELAKENAVMISTIGTPDAPKDFLDKISTSGESEQVGNNMLGEGIRRMAGLLGA